MGIYIVYCLLLYLITWNEGYIRFAKWKREAMERFRRHTTMLNGLMNTVRGDIVSRLSVFVQRNFLSRRYSRLEVLKDQVYVRRS